MRMSGSLLYVIALTVFYNEYMFLGLRIYLTLPMKIPYFVHEGILL